MNLNTVRHAYKAVNLSGHINDTVLHPDAYSDGFFAPLPRQPVAGPRSLPHRVVDAFGDATRNAAYTAQATGCLVRFVRDIMEFQGAIELSALMQAGSPALVMFYHPVANIVIGRGHAPALVSAPEAATETRRNMFDAYNKHTHHGLAGYVLEAAPAWCADTMESHGQHAAATACMLAALAGRCLLQLPRLAMSAEALVIEIIIIAPVVGVLFVCEMSMRAIAGALYLLPGQIAWDASATASFFGQARSWGTIAEDDTSVDDGKPGIHQRLRDRLGKLNQRLQPLYLSETTSPSQINQVVEGMANDLRRYCSQLPSSDPLRGGLALLKATVESLWSPEDGVIFDPPELAMAG